MKVGFIGLGRMGAGMAANLLKAGHEVTVYNRTPGKDEALVAAGAKRAGSVGEACGGEAVVTMLADDHALEAVALGDEGICAVMAKGALHISSSTISVAMAERLTGAHEAAGQSFVSAPVFGRPEAAAAAKLFIVAAGHSDAIERARTVLDAMGQRTFIVSEAPKAANLVKLGGNFLLAAVIESLGEAMALAEKGGVDRHAFLDVMTSTLFDVPVYRNYGGLIAARKFVPAGFAAPLGAKDIGLALAAGDALKAPMPLASLLRDRFLTLLASGDTDLDWSAMGVLAAKDAGIPE